MVLSLENGGGLENDNGIESDSLEKQESSCEIQNSVLKFS
jgi:hypothetical protein